VKLKIIEKIFNSANHCSHVTSQLLTSVSIADFVIFFDQHLPEIPSNNPSCVMQYLQHTFCFKTYTHLKPFNKLFIFSGKFHGCNDNFTESTLHYFQKQYLTMIKTIFRNIK